MALVHSYHIARPTSNKVDTADVSVTPRVEVFPSDSIEPQAPPVSLPWAWDAIEMYPLLFTLLRGSVGAIGGAAGANHLYSYA